MTIVVVPADLRSVAATEVWIVVLRRHARGVRIVVRHRRDSDLDRSDIAVALEFAIMGEYADRRPMSLERIGNVVLAC